jgi:PhzF family phenazine biosynthesis protein
MSLRPFAQVDVFTTEPYRGNPVAVVLDGEDLTTEQMQRLAQWTNLSETTFLLPPSQEGADYRLRIFTPSEELPFAGHPTLGSCHAWRTHNRNDHSDTIVQECGAGLVPIRVTEGGLAFAAPPLVREGPVEDALRERLISDLRLDAKHVQDVQWVDNGPGWVALLLDSADTVLALSPGDLEYKVGVVGPHPSGSPFAFEVRGFFQAGRSTVEDPVTGSLNASLAQWLVGTGRAAAPYVARQGTALGRDGRVYIDRDDDGTIWVGGGTVTCVRGEIEL